MHLRFYHQQVFQNWSLQKFTLLKRALSFSDSLSAFSSITQFLPIRLSLSIWLLGCLLYTSSCTQEVQIKQTAIEKSVELVTGNKSIVFAIATAHFSLDGKVHLIEKYSWLFIPFTALAPLSWKYIQIMDYCEQCENKSELSNCMILLIRWSATLNPSLTLNIFNKKQRSVGLYSSSLQWHPILTSPICRTGCCRDVCWLKNSAILRS